MQLAPRSAAGTQHNVPLDCSHESLKQNHYNTRNHCTSLHAHCTRNISTLHGRESNLHHELQRALCRAQRAHAVQWLGTAAQSMAHLHHELQRALRRAQRAHAVVQPAGAQPALRNLKPAPLACGTGRREGGASSAAVVCLYVAGPHVFLEKAVAA